jgi:hypothetical protein
LSTDTCETVPLTETATVGATGVVEVGVVDVGVVDAGGVGAGVVCVGVVEVACGGVATGFVVAGFGAELVSVGVVAPGASLDDEDDEDDAADDVTCGANGFFVWNTSNETSWPSSAVVGGTSLSTSCPLGAVVPVVGEATFESGLVPVAVEVCACAEGGGFGCIIFISDGTS